MNRFVRKLSVLKQDVRFEPQRKQAIRDSLVNYISAREAVRGAHIFRQHVQRSQYANQLIRFMPVAAVIVIAVLLGGGVSAAAENSLPGDVLYPVKLKVNEEVRAGLAFSADAKAAWEMRRAERRLEEAAELSASGKIGDDERQRIESNFEEHRARVEARIERLDDDGDTDSAVDLALKFEASLAAHENILKRLKAGTDDDAEQLGEKVHEVKIDLRDLRVILEAKFASSTLQGPVVKAAAEGKIGAAENVIAATRSYLDTHLSKIDAQAKAHAEARLTAAQNLVADAKAKVAANLYGEAFLLAGQALRTAHEAKVVVQAETDLKLNLEVEDEDEDNDADDADDDDDVRASSTLQASTTVSSGTARDHDDDDESVEGRGRLELKVDF